jgi:hypothetical protein
LPWALGIAALLATLALVDGNRKVFNTEDG